MTSKTTHLLGEGLLLPGRRRRTGGGWAAGTAVAGCPRFPAPGGLCASSPRAKGPRSWSSRERDCCSHCERNNDNPGTRKQPTLTFPASATWCSASLVADTARLRQSCDNSGRNSDEFMRLKPWRGLQILKETKNAFLFCFSNWCSRHVPAFLCSGQH